MRILLKIAILILASTISISGKTESAEREVKSFLAQYEQAILNRDVNFMERVMADDYMYLSSAGSRENRKQALDYWKQQREKQLIE